MENGKKVLNSPNANYSFGSLQRVFEMALKEVALDLKDEHSVLILGFGAGSLVQTLRNDYDFKGKITGVENDETVIRIDEKHFSEYLLNVELVEDDALKYLQGDSGGYDFVFVDLFIDKEVVEGCLQEGFIGRLAQLLNPGGMIFHNLMLHLSELQEVETRYQDHFPAIQTLHLLSSNQVIVARKQIT